MSSWAIEFLKVQTALALNDLFVGYLIAGQKQFNPVMEIAFAVVFTRHLVSPEISKRIGGVFGFNLGQIQIIAAVNNERTEQEDIEDTDQDESNSCGPDQDSIRREIR